MQFHALFPVTRNKKYITVFLSTWKQDQNYTQRIGTLVFHLTFSLIGISCSMELFNYISNCFTKLGAHQPVLTFSIFKRRQQREERRVSHNQISTRASLTSLICVQINIQPFSSGTKYLFSRNLRLSS